VGDSGRTSRSLCGGCSALAELRGVGVKRAELCERCYRDDVTFQLACVLGSLVTHPTRLRPRCLAFKAFEPG